MDFKIFVADRDSNVLWKQGNNDIINEFESFAQENLGLVEGTDNENVDMTSSSMINGSHNNAQKPDWAQEVQITHLYLF